MLNQMTITLPSKADLFSKEVGDDLEEEVDTDHRQRPAAKSYHNFKNNYTSSSLSRPSEMVYMIMEEIISDAT